MVRHVAALIVALACTPAAGIAQSSVVIRNVTVIPMTGAAPASRQSVIVRDGRIAEIGPSAQVGIPTGASVVDGTGKYLIPGLFEMHAHTSKTRGSALGLYVVNGVTTIRDQGSEHAEVLRWRREIRDGTRVGPRMLIAGPYLESLSNIQRMRRDPPESRVEPFERARIPIGSPADARRVIDSLSALELDHFKVRTVQDSATYLALARAAHAHGKRLVGHYVAASPELFLEAGQDGVEHGFPLAFDALSRDKRMAFWRELAKRDVGVVPTAVVLTESVFRPTAYYQALVADTTGATHPLRPYLSKFMILDWREQVEEVSAERRAILERAWPIWVKQVREMREAGVRIMAGSDVAVLNIFPGPSLHEELRLFVDSVGMSPMEALASATRKPAEWLGMADSVGTVAQGKVADLVLLDADPLADIKNTRRIAAVVLRGKLLGKADLDALREAVRTMPDIRVNDWLRDTTPRKSPAPAPTRPTPPTRDPNTPGFVAKKQLPDGAVPPPNEDGNFLIGPTHPPAPEMTVHEGTPRGVVHTFTMRSEDSRIFPGIARDSGTFGTPSPTDPATLIVTTSHPARYTRTVAVYVPAQYVPGTAAPFIVGADGPDSSLFTALDNLIARKRLPAMIAISIGNGGGDAQGSERGLEYDTMSGRYAEFVESEVLPLVERRYGVRLTKDPDGRATMGGSSGGSAAFIMAWYHPELYHRVLAYSITAINQQWPHSDETPHGAWELHERLIANSPVKPIRVWLEVGDRDFLNPNVMRDGMHDWVLASENMARVLAAKGYHYQYVFARNAGHVDRDVKMQTLPAALEWLWQGYPGAGPKRSPLRRKR
jgi:imidazolonepropionase-like amidohydrolase